ncbi:hypothetical protein ACWGE1_31935 [Streptomyces sp. NPDC054932]
MFIRPMGASVHAANRPAGHPLLRGLLARAAGTAEHTAGAMDPAAPLPGAQPEAPGAAGPGPAEPEPVAAIPAAATPPAEPAPSAGLVAELTQLAVLAREGLLTPQEFTAAKARLLRG